MDAAQSENEPETPEWLSHLQRNSWEPEVIISGLTLALIFAFPAQIYQFSAALIQDFGIPFLGSALVLTYVSFVLNVLKIFFSVHLVMRFTWAGLLGVSYAFPKGVIREKLFKASSSFVYSTPTELVLRLERWCSMAFAFPIVVGVSILAITIYLALLLSAYVIFDWSFSAVYLAFMISLLLFALGMLQLKRFPNVGNRYSRTVFASLSAIYQSNLGKVGMSAYLVFIMIIAAPLAYGDIRGFSHFFPEIALDDEDIAWPDAGKMYEKDLSVDKRFPRVVVSEHQISGNFLAVSVAHYAAFEKEVTALKIGFSDSLSAWNWKRMDQPEDLFRFYAGETELIPTGWQQVKRAGTGQKIHTTMLDVSGLAVGGHTLRVERVVYVEPFLFTTPGIRLRKNWAVVPFYKVE